MEQLAQAAGHVRADKAVRLAESHDGEWGVCM
jgi:hypothetical protein